MEVLLTVYTKIATILLLSITLCAQVTPSQLTAADTKLSTDTANAGLAAMQLLQDAQAVEQLSRALADQNFQQIESAIDLLKGDISTLSGKINDLTAQANNATQEADAARAALAGPYSGIAVTTNPAGQTVLHFTTTAPMTVWVNYGANTTPYTVRTGCAFSGTIPPPQPVTLATDFTFIIPNAHGCLHLQGRDANDTAAPDRGFVF